MLTFHLYVICLRNIQQIVPLGNRNFLLIAFLINKRNIESTIESASGVSMYKNPQRTLLQPSAATNPHAKLPMFLRKLFAPQRVERAVSSRIVFEYCFEFVGHPGFGTDMVIDGRVLSHGSWIDRMLEYAQRAFADIEKLLSSSPGDFDLLSSW